MWGCIVAPADTSDEGKLSAVWVGSTPNLKVSKVTSFGVDDLYFTTTVTLKNLGTETLHDVRYMRNVDPDQEQPWSGSYTTKNYVRYQPGESDRAHDTIDNMALVVAYGATYTQMVLGLGTVHPNARVTHYGFQNNDAGTGWTNTAYKSYSESSPRSADEGINIVFKFDTIDPGASTTFSWAYVLNEGDLIRAMKNINEIKIVQPADTVSGSAATFAAELAAPVDDIQYVKFYISSSGTSDSLVSTATEAASETDDTSVWQITFDSKVYVKGDYTFKVVARVVTDGIPTDSEATKVVTIDNTGPAIRFDPIPTGTMDFPKTSITTVTVVKDTSVSSPDPIGVRFFREVLGESVSLGTDTTAPYTADVDVSDLAFIGYPLTVKAVAYTATQEGVATLDGRVSEPNLEPTDISLDSNSVVENAPGAIVGTLSTSDPNSADTHTYAVTTSSSPFKAQGTSLVVRDDLGDEVLDYETKSSYSVTVRTTDKGGLQFSKTFTILVDNVNEKPTGVTMTTTSMLESASVGTNLGGLSASDPEGGPFTFSITSGSFRWDSSSKVVRTQRVLDFETNPAPTMTVRVTDPGGLSSEFTLTMDVQDVNEAPTAITLSGSSVAENDPGATVATATADDEDDGQTHTWTLTNDAGVFTMSGSTLKVKSGVSLDYEAKPSYTISIKATDNGSPPASIERSFSIAVTNVAESPSPKARTFLQVNENSPPNTNVGTVDLEGEMPPDIDFVITSGNEEGFFRMQACSGQISVVKNGLDFEGGTRTFELDVDVTTEATVPVKVEISVRDINEPPALGDATEAHEETEGGVVYSMPSGFDPDAGDTHTFVIKEGNVGNAFSIDPSSGAILVATTLDYESLDKYTLFVQCTDRNGLRDTFLLTVDVVDVNESPSIPSTTRTVDENTAVGTIVGTEYVAFDQDLDGITFEIIAGNTNDAFTFATPFPIGDQSIKPYQTYLKVAGAIDFESTTEFRLTVRATDDGTPAKSSTASITVNVQDVNEAPSFTQGSYTFTINENTAAGTAVVNSFESNVNDPDAQATRHETTFSVVAGSWGNARSANVLTVDSSSGGISLATVPNYEDISSHSFTLRVTDDGGLKATASVTVNINNVNERPSMPTGITRQITENTASGTEVSTEFGQFVPICASDEDASTTLQYTIGGTRANEKFDLVAAGTNCFTLHGTGALDREDPEGNTFTIPITVSDGALSATQNVIVTVLDANDDPVIADASRSVGENSVAGALVGDALVASDQDTSDSLEFSITGGNSFNAFEISHVTGSHVAQLKVASSVPARLQDLNGASQTWSLVISVTDGEATDTATITVSLVAENDPPVVADKSLSVQENTLVGVLVTTASYTDQENDAVTWSIVSGNDGGAFAIGSSNGRITVAKNILNFEGDTKVYSLVVKAVDLPGNRQPAGDPASALSGSGTITITVLNVNESPVFGTQPSFSVDENLVSTAVGQPMEATDVDRLDATAAWATLTYSITTQNVPFTIDGTTGQISLTSVPLNYEVKSEYSLALLVTDGGGLSATGTVTITVNDLNEPPTVTNAARQVNENSATDGSVLVGAAIPVVDDDSSQSHIWTLGGAQGKFAINNDGQVTVTGALNFEATNLYQLSVTATDPFGVASTATLSITIIDVNEAPVLSASSLADRSVNENVGVGTVVGGAVAATDVDAGAVLRFSLPVSEKTFAIDAVTGVITVKKASLDHETGPSYELDVTVSDGTLKASDTIIVNVADVPEAPVAAFNGVVLDVDEDKGIGAPVGTIVATDVDASTVLTYAHTSQSAFKDDFVIEAATGAISIGPNNVNYETRTEYSFQVIVTDNSGLTDQGTVTIKINDINEKPTWDEGPTMTRHVDENSPVKALVGDPLPASDVDEGQLLLYSIVAGNDDNIFQINPCSGQVTVATAALNYEQRSSYVLTIKLRDDGDPTQEAEPNAELTIMIGDVSEAPVAFDDVFAVDENSVAGVEVGTVHTTDEDNESTALFAIIAGNDDAAFMIEQSSGLIKVAASNTLNFERRQKYDLTIRVTDNDGLTDTSTVTVNVLDVNESPVVVVGDLSIKENSPSGTALGSSPVTFTDVDGNSVTYSLTGGTAQSLFAIDTVSGHITLESGVSLDHETTDSYTLEITATDDGSPQEAGTKTITVTIEDVNENPTLADITVSVAENCCGTFAEGTTSKVGDNVGTPAAAFDVDGDSMTYAIISGDDAEQFRVVVASGGHCQLQVRTNTLNYEAKSTYTLTVRVTDNGLGALENTATFTVNVLDVNEQPWLTPTSREIAENAADDTPAGVPLVGDDYDGSTTLSYSIVGGTGADVFKINSATGQVAANGGVLNYEATPSRTLTIRTSDGSLSSDSTVTINLVNVNEAPVLNDIRLATNEKATAGTAVGSPLIATDVDSSVFSFSIVGDPHSFRIVEATGQIMVDDASVLPVDHGLVADEDTGLVKTFELTIQVQDDGNPAPVRQDTATVTIDVFNQNDPPTAADQFFSIDENVPVGTVVGSLPFTDIDEDLLAYTFASGNIDDMFQIDPTSAQITVRRPLIDYEGRSKYEIVVQARDDGPGEMTGTALATVIIGDVNEDPVANDATMAVDENSAAGTRVGFITGSDVDAGDTLALVWSIDLGNSDGAFRVDTTNGLGEIILEKDVLNFEVQPVRTLTMRATDPDGLYDTSIATVTINDKNDAPIITYQSRDVRENTEIGEEVGGVITANDPDCCDTTRFSMSYFYRNCWQRNEVRVVGSTPDYTFLPVGFDTAGRTELTFTLKGEQWMFLGFAAGRDASADMYEVVIGGVVDTSIFVGVRRAGTRAGAKDMNTYTARTVYSASEWGLMFDSTKDNMFWLTLENGHIEVGTGDRIGIPSTRMVMFDDAATPIAATHLGVSTVNSITATFGRMCFETGSTVGRDALTLDMTTGQLTVKSAINYEAVEAYSFLVDAEDDGEGRLLSSAVVEVRVMDVNEAPVVRDVCSNDAGAEVCLDVDENSEADTLVGTPIIVDDQEAFNTHTFAISDGNIRDAFKIDAATGQISVAKDVLDFEDDLTAALYTLKVTVTDDGSPKQSDVAIVKVTINDVNEQPTMTDFVRSVKENSGATVTMPAVFGSDVDAGENGVLTYTLRSGNTDEFRVDAASGTLGVNAGAVLDYEAGLEYHVIVRATDGGGLFVESRVDISLIDVNERPTIEDAARAVDENSIVGTEVGEPLVAHDVDEGQNLYFSITGGDGADWFRIDPCSGQITVMQEGLDHEGKDTYTLTVVVTDDGVSPPRLVSLPATVTITINDINEVPVVAPGIVKLIDENSAVGTAVVDAAGAAVAHMNGHTVDPDADQTHTWEIVDAQDVFQIDSVTGDISLKRAVLDFEATNTYTVLVIAEDDGSPRLQGNATVTIMLRDENENPYLAAQNREIAENSAVNAFVGAPLVAADPDVNSVDSTWRSFTWSTSHALFDVDPVTGQLKVKQAVLNYEGVNSFEVEVTVTDNGPGALTGSNIITVSITDVNERPQMIDQTFTVPENSAVGKKVMVGGADANVLCSDSDFNQTKTYTMVVDGRRDTEVFIIDPVTGQVTVKIPELNYEVTPSYSFQVVCTDAGLRPQLSITATVTINVVDVNEAPVMASFTRHIDENSGSGSAVLADGQGTNAVSAYDEDADTLEYTITGGDGESLFQIDSASGAITTKSGTVLDYEVKSQYTVAVTATDPDGEASTANTVIDIVDLNEAPVLPATVAFAVRRTPEIGTTIDTIEATDEDRPADPLTYSIVGGDGTFKIEQATGVVSVNNNKASFTTGAVFTRTVRCEDDQGLAATTSMTVTATDANNKPDLADASFSLDENVAHGTKVGDMVFSDDLDIATDGQTYTFTIKQANRPFSVRQTRVGDVITPSIYVEGDLKIDYETTNEYIFDVRVVDSHSTPLSDEGRVVVTINDLNEQPKVLAVTNALGQPLLSVKEDAHDTARTTEVVGDLSFFDQDGGDKGEVTYTIAPDNGAPLGVRPKTGAEYTAEVYILPGSTIDFEATPEFTFTVTVTDTFGLSDSKAAAVTVLNMNDPPTVGSFAWSVNEDAAEGFVIGTVTGADVDDTPLTWEIVGGDPANHFSLHPNTGVLTVASLDIDYESQELYNLEIEATDLKVGTDTRVHKVRTTVPITVINVNDITITGYLGAVEHSTAGDDTVIIRGTNIGKFSEPAPVSVTYGPTTGTEFTATDCSVTINSIEVTCKTVAGLGGKLRWTVTVEGFTKTSPADVVTKYKDPVITDLSLSVVSMPTLGGTTVTLTGTDFSDTIEKVVVSYSSAGRTYIATGCKFFPAHTVLQCQSAPGVGTDLKWRVKVADLESAPASHASVSSYAVPTVTNVFPSATEFSTGGTQLVTIEGANFGVPGLEAFNKLKVTYGPPGDFDRYTASGCTVVAQTSHRNITCRTAAGVGAGHSWQVTVGEQTSVVDAAVRTTSYRRPTISFVGGQGAKDATTEGGQDITIRGVMFGPRVLAAGSVPLKVTYGATGTELTAQSCVISAEHTGISCKTAEGTGKDHSWVVEVDGQASQVFAAGTSYGNPIISFYGGAHYTELLTSGGQQVEIHGHNFGMASLGNDIHMTYGPTGTEFVATGCFIPDAHKHKLIICNTTEAAGRSHKWEVTIDGQLSEAPTTHYGAPEVHKVTGFDNSDAHSFSTYGGEVVEITGLNFGPADRQDEFFEKVTYGPTGGEYTAVGCEVVSHTRINCFTVAGSGADHMWIVHVEGQASAATSSVTTSYKRPQLLASSVYNGRTNGAFTITLTGMNLGIQDPNTEILIEIRGVGDDKIQIPIPASQLQAGGVVQEQQRRALAAKLVNGRVVDQVDTVEFTMVEGRGAAKQIMLVVRHRDAPDVERKSDPIWFDYDQPIVSRIVTREVPVAGSSTVLMDVSVLGFNFGKDPNPVSNVTHGTTSEITILVEYEDLEGVTQTDVVTTFKKWSHEEINFERNQGGRVIIETRTLLADGSYSVNRTKAVSYDFFSPSLAFLTGAEAGIPPLMTNGSAVVTIKGRNLWSEGVPTSVSVGGESTGKPCTNVRRGSIVLDDEDDQLSPNQWVSATVPPFTGKHVPFVVFKELPAGRRGSLPMYLDFEDPVITGIMSTTGSAPVDKNGITTARTDGTSFVTFTGRNFGFNGSAVRFTQAGFDFDECTVSDTSMTCRVPEGEGAYLAGSTPFTLEAHVPRLTCANNAEATDTEPLFCDVAVDRVFTQYAAKTPPGQAWRFQYAAPVVEEVTTHIDSSGGEMLIKGHNFGVTTSAPPQVALVRTLADGETETLTCETSENRVFAGGLEQLRCIVEEGTGANWKVQVDVDGIKSSVTTVARRRLAAHDFAFAAPQVDYADVTTGTTAGGYTITLVGSSMGGKYFQGDSNTAARGKVVIRDVDSGATDDSATVLAANHTHVTFTMPSGIGRKQLSVHVDGQDSNSVDFQYLPPQFAAVGAVTPDEIPTAGGVMVTLRGTSFGMEQGHVHISFPELVETFIDDGGVVVTRTRPADLYKCNLTTDLNERYQCSVKQISHTEMQLFAPKGMGRNNGVTVVVGDGPFAMKSQTLMLHYLPPTVNQVIPNIIDSQGTTVRMLGENFGDDTAMVQIEFDGVRCVNASVKTDRNVDKKRPFLECQSPRQVVGPKNITLRAAFQTTHMDKDDGAATTKCYKDFYGQVGEVCLECPLGADCAGFEGEPIAQSGWYNLKGREEASGHCVEDRGHRKDLEGQAGCNYIVPCEPKNACAGANQCGIGYRDEPPLYRCSACADRYYRLAGECIECPDNPWLIVVAFLCVAVFACVAGWMLNSKNVNVAFVSIGVDYFQVLALFANSKVQWPAMVKDMFHMLSIFNLNLELTAPECSIPDLGYKTKWYFIQALPLVANSLFAILYVTTYLHKKCILRRSGDLHRHASALVATSLVMFYYLYLYITRTVLDVFNCAPTEPPDGKEYLSVVFEPCWEAGGLQMTLLPLAVIALLVYSMGYPTVVFWLLYRNRELIMEDQLLRAKGTGDTRLENRHAYLVRKRYHKLYYHFRPDKWYWIMCVLARKFGIAFTALMFNKNPAFQLSMALLVMFVSYAAQVKHTPYMSNSERGEVLKAHRDAADAGDPVHSRLRVKLAEVDKGNKKRGRRFSWGGSGMPRRFETGTVFCFNYNTVESVLLFCAVLVNLAGVMFESNRFETDYFQVQKDIITVVVLIIIFFSIIYFAVVLVTEVYLMIKENNERKAIAKGKKPRLAKSSSRKRIKEVSAEDVVMQDSGVNPMFAKQAGSAAMLAGTRDMASGELYERNKKLLDEIAKLKKEQQTEETTSPASALSTFNKASPANRRRAHNKTEFRQVNARVGRRGRGGKRATPGGRKAASAGAAAAEDDAPAPTSPRMSMNPVASAGDAPASPADSTPLPAGWKAATDKKSGRTYYVNRVTRKTSWRRPTE